MSCPACRAENDTGARFCQECGTPLSLVCAQCGASQPPRARFCNQCGAPQAEGVARPAGAPPAPGPQVNEQRLVTILFMDLVGFTPLSENRDPSEVRELLSRYFDVSRQLVERYNGTVQKFIGDAVVAVWGTPTARQDDAERAVRTGLELISAVAELETEAGGRELRARVGVHTGLAAVSVGLESEGMVVGDMVNTASRIQSAAGPGEILVGEATRLASEAAIAYEDAGTHELKGKSEPLHLWRAVRVVATRGGALRSRGLEPPFVGREREFRLAKELFHATVDDGRTHHLAVTGVAGIGKSRLAWEFEKYIDGVKVKVLWHQGRCLSYGNGVAYSALADMIRARAGIVEAEDPGPARTKLRESVETYVSDPEERAWIEPRLAHLLGLEEREDWEREELFSGWRLFIERLAGDRPVVMVFEDMQWADAGLLDFIDSMLERSRGLPLFVVTLARPDLEREDLGRGWRNATSLYLEPLTRDRMGTLLDGMVPGLPAGLRDSILERSEGVPLYAVEMVRMLLGQGVLVQEDGACRLTGTVETLKVPDTLQSLIAARLDELSPEERRLLQTASVLGKTFRKEALAALLDVPAERLDELLAGLLKKEVVSLQADPRSPERGQYEFIQDLIRHVAYEMLPKRERRALHLAVAAYFEEAWASEELEIVEVLAFHYLEAHRLLPDAEDADAIRARAHATLIRAAERAASLAASDEARHLFEQAASVAPDVTGRAELLERAGSTAWSGGGYDGAAALHRQALELFESVGNVAGAARAAAHLAEVEWRAGDLESALERMNRAFEVLSDQEPDESLAIIAAQLARFTHFHGHIDRAGEVIEVALKIAEDLGLPEVLAEALNTKSLIIESTGHPQEGLGLRFHALKVALDNDKHTAALRAYNNCANGLVDNDQFEAAIELAGRGVALARKLGGSRWEAQMLSLTAWALYELGRWDEALEVASQQSVTEDSMALFDAAFAGLSIRLARGGGAAATQLPPEIASLESRTDIQDRGAYLMAASRVLLAQGRTAEALSASEEAISVIRSIGIGNYLVRLAYGNAFEAACDLGDEVRLMQLLAALDRYPTGHLTRSMKALVARFRGRLAALTGAPGAAVHFRAAANGYRDLGMADALAHTLLDHAAWLSEEGKSYEADPLEAEARDLLERLGVMQPAVERASEIGTGDLAQTPAS